MKYNPQLATSLFNLHAYDNEKIEKGYLLSHPLGPKGKDWIGVIGESYHTQRPYSLDLDHLYNLKLKFKIWFAGS